MDSNTHPILSSSAALWKERYETLRQCTLNGVGVLSTQPMGLVLLIRGGVADWMRQWNELASQPIRPASQSPAAVASSQGLQEQLTEVLVQMSLAHA